MTFILIIILPLFGAFISGGLSFFIGRQGSVFISTCTILFTFLCSLKVLNFLIQNQINYHIIIGEWIHCHYLYCNWGFLFDPLSLVLICVVTSISTIVHLYSFKYMYEDPHLSRFMSYLSLFTFFMILLVTADNYIVLFIGWEGVGLCSYLLINFWYTRIQANKAAIKAIIVNRISDLIYLLGLFVIFYYLKSVECFSIFGSILLLENHFFLNTSFSIIDIICILLLIGSMSKSAQIFLHTWLPDAMEGPTPVSALIHAATMVTAGVYLITRSSPIFEYSPFSLNIMTLIGSLTAIFGSTVALFQNDIKKIIAYSTCSQLGYMFFTCGLSNYPLAIFHLSSHAYFKALLFLCSGSIIHGMLDEQDIRKMGGLRRIFPFTYLMFLISSLSLSGFPFLSGFYSKDLILENAFSTFSSLSHFSFFIGILCACLTTLYSIRLIFFTFLCETNSYKIIIQKAHEPSYWIIFSLSILFIGSIFFGFFFKEMFVGMGTDFWNNSIYIKYSNIKTIDLEFLPLLIKLLPVILSFFSIIFFIYYIINFKKFYFLKLTEEGKLIYNFFNRKWFFDKIYNEGFNQYILKSGYTFSYKKLDKGLIEKIGPTGLTFFFYNWSKNLSLLQSGNIYHYSLYIFFSIIIIICILQNFIICIIMLIIYHLYYK